MKIPRQQDLRLVINAVLLAGFTAILSSGCGGSSATTIEEPPQPPPPLVLEQTDPDPEPILTPVEPPVEVVEPEPLPEPPPKPAFSLATIHFAFDAFELMDASLERLRKNAEILHAYPEAEIVIEGHCDERGTIEYNLALGDKRARAAKAYLMQLGIEESRISTISFGKEKPVNQEQTEAAWAENRRAEFARK